MIFFTDFYSFDDVCMWLARWNYDKSFEMLIFRWEGKRFPPFFLLLKNQIRKQRANKWKICEKLRKTHLLNNSFYGLLFKGIEKMAKAKKN